MSGIKKLRQAVKAISGKLSIDAINNLQNETLCIYEKDLFFLSWPYCWHALAWHKISMKQESLLPTEKNGGEEWLLWVQKCHSAETFVW